MAHKKHWAAAVGAALAVAGAGLAIAQDSSPPVRNDARGDMRERQEQRMRDLLQLRADQEAAWRQYLAAVQPPDRPERGPGGDPDGLSGMTTPQRLDRMAALMAEQQARFQATSGATRSFYAALSPSQQKAFDALFKGGPGGMGMAGGPPPGPGGPGRGPGPGQGPGPGPGQGPGQGPGGGPRR